MNIHGTERPVTDREPNLEKKVAAWVTELEQDDVLKARVAADARRVQAGLAPEGVEIDLSARLVELRAELDGSP